MWAYSRSVGQPCPGVPVAHELGGPQEGQAGLAGGKQPGEGHAADLLLREDDARPGGTSWHVCSLDFVLRGGAS